uniref:Transposon protein, putative, CACTA, En/Spm sub-class, expressed n=1 Tax=Oryza sativa subsp. japonica TaxID=39947 RepID=Q2QVD5_ORYSJ|nr:transposon protein, putative, CACTA, En/Spm sub-class, expressed [Oryza sativa Japonica Group]
MASLSTSLLLPGSSYWIWQPLSRIWQSEAEWARKGRRWQPGGAEIEERKRRQWRRGDDGCRWARMRRYPLTCDGPEGKAVTGEKVTGFPPNPSQMDRRWMYYAHHSSTEYREGVTEFVTFADNDRKSRMSMHMLCPCRDCKNEQMIEHSDEVHAHLIMNGFMKKCTCWTKHGEQEAPNVAAEEVLDQDVENTAAAREGMFVPSPLGGENIDLDTQCLSTILHDIEDAEDNDRDFEKFSKLVEDCQMPLYDGCKPKHNKLSCVLELMKLKASNGWSDKSFTELLELLKDLLPEGNNLPQTTYEAKQVLCPLGLEEYADLDVCPVCGASRYKRAKSKGEGRLRQPGNDIDVFLEPIIDDFERLWNEDTRTWDAYAQEYFNLHAMLFCTINDYPTLSDLSGQTVKGKWACSECMEETRSKWLKHSHKTVYMGHMRFLPRYHPYRNMKKNFNGHRDTAGPPAELTGIEVHNLVMGITNEFGKKRKVGKTKKKSTSKEKIEEHVEKQKKKERSMWKKKSIFWRLLYWKDLEVHHCIDLMHVEKNLLPIAIRNILPPKVRHTIQRLCFFFHAIGQKIIDPEGLDELQAELVRTLCHLEMYFRPTFFDIMEHLPLHLVRQTKFCGPAFMTQMYSCERYLGILKGYVRNRSHPEGSIIESYTTEEHMTEVVPYVDEHLAVLRQENPDRLESWVRNKHISSFNEWLKNRIARLQNLSSKTLQWLSQGPEWSVTTWQGYDINGYTFHTVDLRNVKVDNEGFTTVNLANNAYKDEPFILAKQVVQVFYIVDPCNKKLHVVREGKRRIIGLDNIADEDDYNQHVHGIGQEIPLEEEEEEDDVQYARVDHKEGLFL